VYFLHSRRFLFYFLLRRGRSVETFGRRVWLGRETGHNNENGR